MNQFFARILAMMGAMGNSNAHQVRYSKIPTITEFRAQQERIKRRLEVVSQRQGLTKFLFADGWSCWALNERNAMRKHQNYLDGMKLVGNVVYWLPKQILA